MLNTQIKVKLTNKWRMRFLIFIIKIVNLCSMQIKLTFSSHCLQHKWWSYVKTFRVRLCLKTSNFPMQMWDYTWQHQKYDRPELHVATYVQVCYLFLWSLLNIPLPPEFGIWTFISFLDWIDLHQIIVWARKLIFF